METWDKLPLNLMDRFAENETYSRDAYRPIYSIHKWWARRPGSTFRMLGLAALSDDDTTQDQLLRENATGNYDGEYFTNHQEEFQDETILDPFAGGGTTMVELNRLGADTIGYEINPVAWWIIKKSIDELDLDEYERAYQELLDEVREDIGPFYKTTDPDTGEEVEILYSFQSQKLPCLTCGEEVNLYPRYILGKNQANSPGFVFCPNEECDDRIIEIDRKIGSLEKGDTVTTESGETVQIEIDGQEVCSHCGHLFNPSGGNAGRGKFTCSNNHKNDVMETLQRIDEKPEFDYFALYYKLPDGTKKFKEPDKSDIEKIEEVEQYYEENKQDLPIPTQKIPDGHNTRQIINWNYTHFDELFSVRHLVTFGELFKRAKEVEDQNLREFLIIALSNSLEYNGKLVRWNPRYRSSHVFENHAYIPRVQPIEGNPLNHDQNANAVENFFRKVYRAKEWCQRPFEKVKNSQTGDLSEIYVNNEYVSEDRLEGLNCQTSERMNEDDESVDYIITDPPYYDNVMYSELSDYFYVWLHQALAEDYDIFEPKYTPKTREIVASDQVGKDEDFFVQGLVNVFEECNRVLKEDGEMVFTYHHNENEAWSVILEAIINSGFTIAGGYPVQSELPTSSHIEELDNAEYDILIFANKENVDEEITLEELQQNLYFELEDMIEEERERHDNLGQADLGVILRGKCMYYYSKHYPHVYSDEEQASVDEALETVDAVIEQVLEGSVNLPSSIDVLSEAYAAFMQRGPEEYDDLNKQLLAKNLNVSELEEEKLVKGPRERKEPVGADERVHHIKRKLNGNGKAADDLLDIDKVQYLYHLYKTDQNVEEYLKEWNEDDVKELAEFMAEVTGDDRYAEVTNLEHYQYF